MVRVCVSRIGMQIPVKLFAMAKQLAGTDMVVLDLPAAATVAQLRAALVEECPSLERIIAQSMIAVNSEYAADDRVLGNAMEVGCIPPVSGG
jgi:molybdopterin converting factor subunit 1